MKKKVYAFIDSQNVNIGTLAKGWKLDWGSLRLLLRNKYNVEKAFLFIGYIKDNEKLYSHLKRVGYILVYKNVLEYSKKSEVKVKGNVDAELVLHTMIEINNFDSCIIISGDGDFYCLIEYLAKRKKLYKIMTPNNHYSSLIRKYSEYIVDLYLLRHKLEYKKERHSRGKQG